MKIFKIIIISVILIIGYFVIATVSYNYGIDDGYEVGFKRAVVTIDSLFILVPKSILEPKPEVFEDDLLVKYEQSIQPINCHHNSPYVYRKRDYFCWYPTEQEILKDKYNY